MPSQTRYPQTITTTGTGLGGFREPWQNPGNASADDANAATCDTGGGGGDTEGLRAVNCNFEIPDNVDITGVLVEIKKSSSGGGWFEDTIAMLVVGSEGGGQVGTEGSNLAKLSEAWKITASVSEYGGDDTVWSTTLGGVNGVDIVNSNEFGAYLVAKGVEDPGGSMGDPITGNVFFIRITVWYEEGSSSSSQSTTPVAPDIDDQFDPPPEQGIPYLPFSAFVQHFLGMSSAPTGPTQASGTLYAAQFRAEQHPVSLINHPNALKIGTGHHQGTEDWEENNFSNWRLRGQFHKHRVPLESFQVDDVLWPSIPSPESQVIDGVSKSVLRLTKRTGYRFYRPNATNGFFFPNCIIDDAGSIVHFVNALSDARWMVEDGLLFDDAGSGEWKNYVNRSTRVQYARGRLNRHLFYYAFGLEPEATAALQWGYESHSGGAFSVVNPGWQLYIRGDQVCLDKDDEAIVAFRDSILNTSQIAIPASATTTSPMSFYQDEPLELGPSPVAGQEFTAFTRYIVKFQLRMNFRTGADTVGIPIPGSGLGFSWGDV